MATNCYFTRQILDDISCLKSFNLFFLSSTHLHDHKYPNMQKYFVTNTKRSIKIAYTGKENKILKCEFDKGNSKYLLIFF